MINNQQDKWAPNRFNFVGKNEWLPEYGRQVWALIEQDVISSPEVDDEAPFILKLVLKENSNEQISSASWQLIDPEPDQDEILHQDLTVVSWRYVT